MLVESFVDAILVDADHADLVWGAWYVGEIDDWQAERMWQTIAFAGEMRNLFGACASPGFSG